MTDLFPSFNRPTESEIVICNSKIFPKLTINGSGTIIYANNRIESLFGYELNELHEKSVEIFLDERLWVYHRERRVAYFTNPVMRPMNNLGPVQVLQKNRQKIHVVISVAGFYWKGEPYATAIVMRSDQSHDLSGESSC